MVHLFLKLPVRIKVIFKKNNLEATLFESQAGYITINSENDKYKDKEYIITIGKDWSNTEICNYANLNENCLQYQTNSVLGYNIASYISSTINIKENNIHYFKFPHIKKEN